MVVIDVYDKNGGKGRQDAAKRKTSNMIDMRQHLHFFFLKKISLNLHLYRIEQFALKG